jgi:hypothetical protein
MRPVERINNFLQKVNWSTLIRRWRLSVEEEVRIIKNLDFIKTKWEKFPDQRIGQLLINLNLIKDHYLIWVDEEYEILRDQGIPPEEYLFWTSYLDKDENKLDKPITRLVSDLDVSHIRAIKSYFNKHQVYLPPHYVEALNNTLTKKGH